MSGQSWKPNTDGTVWTFNLRKGVKFHSGGENEGPTMSWPASAGWPTRGNLRTPCRRSRAFFQKGEAKKVDDYTVEFHLDAPNGNFPYLVSSDNYNAIIIPADYSGGFEKNFIGTGPFKLEKYTPKVGASFVRNP